MTTRIKPSNVVDDTYVLTANNSLNLGGTLAAQHYTEARVTITNVEPSTVGSTSNGHIWFVYT